MIGRIVKMWVFFKIQENYFLLRQYLALTKAKFKATSSATIPMKATKSCLVVATI